MMQLHAVAHLLRHAGMIDCAARPEAGQRPAKRSRRQYAYSQRLGPDGSGGGIRLCFSMLNLPDDVTDVQQVQRQYKRLAALCHPDKCRLPQATAAFTALHAAYEEAVCLLQRSQQDGEALADTGVGQERDSSHGQPSHCSAADHYDNDDEYAWWKPWDEQPAPSRRKTSGACEPQCSYASAQPTSSKGAQCQEGRPEAAAVPHSRDADVGNAAAAGRGSSGGHDRGGIDDASSRGGFEQWREDLSNLQLEDLRAAVQRLQKAVIFPSTDEERSMGVSQRQQRLAIARSLLAEGAASDRLQKSIETAGGFT